MCITCIILIIYKTRILTCVQDCHVNSSTLVVLGFLISFFLSSLFFKAYESPLSSKTFASRASPMLGTCLATYYFLFYTL